MCMKNNQILHQLAFARLPLCRHHALTMAIAARLGSCHEFCLLYGTKAEPILYSERGPLCRHGEFAVVHIHSSMDVCNYVRCSTQAYHDGTWALSWNGLP